MATHWGMAAVSVESHASRAVTGDPLVMAAAAGGGAAAAGGDAAAVRGVVQVGVGRAGVPVVDEVAAAAQRPGGAGHGGGADQADDDGGAPVDVGVAQQAPHPVPGVAWHGPDRLGPEGVAVVQARAGGLG